MPVIHKRRGVVLCLALAGIGGVARGQVSVGGSSLLMRSGGTSGTTAVLPGSGSSFAGTYLVVPAGGATVNFTVNASAGTTGTGSAHMNLVVADSVTGFNVTATSATGYTTGDISLPAGKYVVRAERDYASNVGVTRAMNVNSLAVNTVSGGAATFSNSGADAGTNALAAADTYIESFRKGTATVTLTGPGGVALLPGTPVRVDLARHAFNFGTAVPGTSTNSVNAYLGGNGTTQQTSYQQRLNQNFNAVVPENMGKWSSNEGTRDVVSMGGVDAILNYAQAHNMRARMHNVIWGSQQPTWVNTLLANAGNGDAAAKTDLRGEVSERIDYYVGTGAANDRARKYVELDVYNESYHTGSNAAGNNNYWKIYGAAGVGDIYNEVATTVAGYGAAAPKLFVNEYNGLQNMNDNYGNWYSTHVTQLRDAGGTVSGIGVQYYPDASIGTGNTQHSTARIEQVLQNLSTQGVSLALTEFGAGAGSQATTAQILGESVRLVFGTAASTGFFMWGFQDEGSNLFKDGAALYTVGNNFNTWTITEAGKAWQDLLGIQDWDGNPDDAWDTLVDTTAGAGGQVTFKGFYGDYYLRGQTSGEYDLTLVKGASSYSVAMAAPPTWSIWNVAGSGQWGTGGSWSAGGVPNAAGYTAYFGPVGAVRNVTVSGNQTVGMIVLDAPAGGYQIGGTGTITIQGFGGAGGSVAAIRVVSGNHAMTAPLVFVTPAELTMGDGAVLDIGGNTLVLTNAAGAIREYLGGGQLWASGADPLGVYGVAYLDNGAGTLVRRALVGDANMDGRIDGDDFALIDSAFARGGADARWWDGDFDYDGVVTAADYLMLDTTVGRLAGGASPEVLAEREARFGEGYVAALIAGVPEPSGTVAGLTAIVLGVRRRR